MKKKVTQIQASIETGKPLEIKESELFSMEVQSDKKDGLYDIQSEVMTAQKPKSIEEEVSEVKITEVISEEIIPDKAIEKQVIKKKAGKSQEITDIVKVQEENKGPDSTDTILRPTTIDKELENISAKNKLEEQTLPIEDSLYVLSSRNENLSQDSPSQQNRTLTDNIEKPSKFSLLFILNVG